MTNPNNTFRLLQMGFVLGRSVGFMVIFVPLSLFKAAGYGLNITKIVLAIVGVLFIVAGNYLPKNQPNSIAGYNYRGQKQPR